MRNFSLEILDSDGEQHTYSIVAKDAYTVARKARVIAQRYGHSADNAVNVIVSELVADADMTNAVTIKRGR
jgi:hypothetical protein